MKRGFYSVFAVLLVAIHVLILAACNPAQQGGTAAPSPQASATDEPFPAATQTAEPEVPAQASPTVSTTATAPPQEEASATPASTASATATPLATPTAQPSATRPTPGVVVTSEPNIDVWSHGSGVVTSQIEGSLRTSIGFLNSLIVDSSGNSSLPYLNEALHAEALAGPDDGVVLGIDASYEQFEVNWLGPAGASSEVEVVLTYKGGGAQRVHLLSLRQSDDAWQITRVSGL